MTTKPLDLQTSPDKNAANLLVEFTYADLTTTSGAQTLTPFTLPANWSVRLTHMELPEAFVSSDATQISTAITAGDAGSANRLLTSTELNAAGTEIFNKGGALTSATAYVPTAATAQTITVTPTTAKSLATHTAGRVRLFYHVINPFSNLNQPVPFDISAMARQ